MSGKDENPDFSIETLTPRERHVIRWICDGLTCREIAARLSVPEPAAREEIFTILDKLAVPDRVQLVVFAFRHRVVEPLQS